MVRTFDIIIIVFLVFSIIMFLTGNGEALMGLFSGKNGLDTYKIYDKKKYERACLIFMVALLLIDLGLIFLSDRFPQFNLISVVLVILAFGLFSFYIRRYARK
ncbi:MAG: hypothetical protein Q4G47_01080 [Lachnospiraceae bacterium]|nr:hypothetical protein [Lachnospiraceae bacterium]